MARPSTTMPPGLDRFVIINGHPDDVEKIIGGSIDVHDDGGVIHPIPVPSVDHEKVELLPMNPPHVRADVISILIQTMGCDFSWTLDFTGRPFRPVYVTVGMHQSHENAREARPICHVLLSNGLSRCIPGVMTAT